jgi:hypothetical protein
MLPRCRGRVYYAHLSTINLASKNYDAPGSHFGACADESPSQITLPPQLLFES